MNITLRAKDVALMTEDLKEFAEKKFASLEKFVGDGADVRVDFSKDSNHVKHGDVFKVSVEVNTHGDRFHTEESAKDFKTAINGAKDELQRQINAKKGSGEAKRRDAAKSVRDIKAGL